MTKPCPFCGYVVEPCSDVFCSKDAEFTLEVGTGAKLERYEVCAIHAPIYQMYFSSRGISCVLLSRINEHSFKVERST